MKYFKVGNTGVEVSWLSWGAVKAGRNTAVKFPEHFELPTDKELLAFLERLQELGINTICMSRGAYGNSTERLAELLPVVGGRDAWVVVENVGETFDSESEQSFHDFSEKAIIESVEGTLKILNTDHLDVVLLHSNGDEKFETTAHLEALPALEKLKDDGKIRAFGISTKTVAGGLAALEYGVDALMVTCFEGYDDEYSVMQKAAEKGTAVFVKKSMGSGKVPNPTGSLAYVLEKEEVSSVVLGTISIPHLEANCAVAERLCEAKKKRRFGYAAAI